MAEQTFTEALEKSWTSQMDESSLARRESLEALWKKWEQVLWDYKRWLEMKASGVTFGVETHNHLVESIRESTISLSLTRAEPHHGIRLIDVVFRWPETLTIKRVEKAPNTGMVLSNTYTLEQDLINMIPTVVRIVRDLGGTWGRR